MGWSSYALIDVLPLWSVAGLTALALTLAIQIGRRIGRARSEPEGAAHAAHAVTISGALLALLGLLLAFAFSGVEARYGARKRLAIEEANAIGTTFLRAGFLDREQRDGVREVLREYVEIPRPRTMAELEPLLERSNQLQGELWRLTEESALNDPHSEVVAHFIDSVNDVINLREERVTTSIYQRFPPAILIVLGIVAVLSIGVLGYAAGLTRARARLPTAAMVAAVSCVVTLIMALDRPTATLIDVSDHAMMDVRDKIRAYWGDGHRAPPAHLRVN